MNASVPFCVVWGAGTIQTGDLMYIPCKGIHVFESLGDSLGIRFHNYGGCPPPLPNKNTFTHTTDTPPPPPLLYSLPLFFK